MFLCAGMGAQDDDDVEVSTVAPSHRHSTSTPRAVSPSPGTVDCIDRTDGLAHFSAPSSAAPPELVLCEFRWLLP